MSEAERHDLDTVCDALGLHRAALDVLLADPPSRAQPMPQSDQPSLRGNSVCFTGELLGFFKGERITREVSEKLAAEAGLDVRPSVTKRLDLLVVADPDTQSIKARKAREYGVRIIAEQVLWRALGISVEFGRTGFGVLVALALLLTGCANPTHYYHPDRTLSDFSADHAACARYAAHRPEPGATSGLVIASAYRHCMLGKGWQRSDSPDLPNHFRGIERDREVVFDQIPKQPAPMLPRQR